MAGSRVSYPPSTIEGVNSALLLSNVQPLSTTQYPTSNLTGAAPTISTTVPTGLTFIAPDNAAFTYNGTVTAYATNYKVIRTSAAAVTSFTVQEFQHSGTRVVLRIIQTANEKWQLYVDDQPVYTSLQTPTNPGVATYVDITFATRGNRNIRVMSAGTIVVGGVYIPTYEDVYKSPTRFKIGLYGDSYFSRANDMTIETFAYYLSLATGWNVFEMGQPGTGYLNNAAGASGKAAYTDSGRLSTMNSYGLDALVIDGSINDVGYVVGTDASAIQTAATGLYNQILALDSTLPLFVLGAEPVISAGTTLPATYTPTNNAVKAAAQAATNVVGFMDWYGEDWLTGNGRVGATAGNGNQDYYIGADGLHPNIVGSTYLSSRLFNKIRDVASTALY